MFGTKSVNRGVVMAVILMLLTAAPSVVVGKTYTMTGKITAIDRAYDTIVIEVPMASKMFTVAGPLAANAKLAKNNRMVGLGEFKVGERVAVKWHSTAEGHVIDRLVSK